MFGLLRAGQSWQLLALGWGGVAGLSVSGVWRAQGHTELLGTFKHSSSEGCQTQEQLLQDCSPQVPGEQGVTWLLRLLQLHCDSQTRGQLLVNLHILQRDSAQPQPLCSCWRRWGWERGP